MKHLNWIAVATFVGFGALATPVLAQSTAGNISEMVGKVQVVRNDGNSTLDAATGFAILNGDLIETSNTGRAKLLLQDQSVISIAPKSKFKVSKVAVDRRSKQRESSFYLLAGAVKSFVSSFWGSDNSFEIRSKTAVAGVRGTTFSFELAEDGSSIVTVLEGEVEVYNPQDKKQRKVSVKKNQKSEVKEGRTPGKPEDVPEGQGDGDFDFDSEEEESSKGGKKEDELGKDDLPPADDSLNPDLNKNPDGTPGGNDGFNNNQGSGNGGGQDGVDVPDTGQILRQDINQLNPDTKTRIKVDF